MRNPVRPVAAGLTGVDLIDRPLLNKGTAFTEDERSMFRLHGLLPPHVGTLEEQMSRRLKALRRFGTDFERYVFLRELQDTNETLFYALLVANLEEFLPIVYTPTVGEGCQRFSEIWRKPRGLFLSYPNRGRMREILADPRLDAVRVIVATDGERILGLGDQGAGGMGIPIGKLALYTGCAGIHPAQTLPILLDAGTDNAERLADPLYVGWRHERIRGAEYDAFIEEFVSAVAQRWPNVLLQWEDFAGGNAQRLLDRYRDRLCTFNDDIQGTAAVAGGTLWAALEVTGVPLAEQRIVFFGAGSAASGMAALLTQAMVDGGMAPQEARRRMFALGRNGLLVEGMANVRPEQAHLAHPREDVAGWKLSDPGRIGLEDVVANARPTTLIGTSGQAGAFTEAVVREMAKHAARPIIFPLSNPTSHSEATPAELMQWTEGRALIGTGSPFPNVAQTNNSYVFPGVGLGVLAAEARRVTDSMFMAAGKALAAMSPALRDKAAPLLPAVKELRAVSFAVANAVGRQAQADGVAPRTDEATLAARIRANVWTPAYRSYRAE